jgi:predicted transcriptional regulator
MSSLYKYGAAALAFILILAASHYSAYQWGNNAARLKQSEQTNEALAKSAQHIIDEQSKLNQIEDVIRKSPSSKIKSPVLMRTLVRLPDCAGKTQCSAP